MTPINAIASVPPGSPGLESGAARNARQAAPDGESTTKATDKERGFWDRLWGKDGFSFGALLDAINPLQHIPVVSTIYRAATGDTIGPAPRIMGGALFGGVIGLIASAADAVVEGVTGKDTGSHVLAMLPDPDPVSQWATDDGPRQRATMTAILNLPDKPPTTQFADNETDKTPRASDAAAAAPAVTPVTARDTKPAQPAPDAPKTDAANLAANNPAAKTTPVAAALQNPAAVIPAAAQHFATPPARTAQAGAGGNVVPLSNHGRPVTKLPSPKELAANPELLQGMRQGGAAAAAQQKSTGRIDTAIKGHGLLAPGAARPDPMVTPAAFDGPPNMGDASQTTAPRATGSKPVTPVAATRDTSSIPEVGPDFLMKMQQALDKYQSMRAPPTVDVAR